MLVRRTKNHRMGSSKTTGTSGSATMTPLKKASKIKLRATFNFKWENSFLKVFPLNPIQLAEGIRRMC